MLSPACPCFVCRHLGLFFSLLIKINKQRQSYFWGAGFTVQLRGCCLWNGGGWQGQAGPAGAGGSTPGPLAVLPLRGCWQGHTRSRVAWLPLLHVTSGYGRGQGSGAATWHEHVGDGILHRAEGFPPPAGAWGGGRVWGAGVRGSPACSVTFLALSCCCGDVLSPSAGELFGRKPEE